MDKNRPPVTGTTVFATTSPFAMTSPFAITSPAKAADPTGALPEVPGYRLQKLLGQGGMGSVYLAEQCATGRSVAVKVMHRATPFSAAQRTHFLREIRVMAALRHPHLVEFLEAGEAAGDVYFAMELSEGGSVSDEADRVGGLLGVERSVAIILSALDGLSYAHGQGYVHRDLKPENILLTAKGEDRAKVADFGLAKSFLEAGLSGVTASGTAAGSLHFMPKEQLVNYKRVRPSTDVWAMAATLYWLLTGAAPREMGKGENPAAVILRRPATPIRKRAPDVPAPLADAIDLALSDGAAARPQHAGALRALLAGAVAK